MQPNPQIIRVRFGHPFRAWQRECARLSAGLRFLVLVLHRRAGKTELALKKLLDAAMKNTLPDPLYVYAAPFRNQAKTLVWDRLKTMTKVMAETGHATIQESELSVRFLHNNALVRLGGADNPDSWRGITLDGCVLDEPGQMKHEVWEEVLRPALSDRKGWAWFTGTPKGINFFSHLFFTMSKLPGWGKALYTVYQTDALDPNEVAQVKLEQSEQTFAREYLCDFSAAGEDQLMSLTDVEVAAQRVYQESDVAHAAKVMGVDPARFGNDRSVVMKRQGLQVFDPVAYRSLSTMDLAGRVGMHIDQWKPDTVFVDVGGMGAGVVDRLIQLGYDQVVGVDFGSKPLDMRFANKRAEMWYLVKEAIESGLSIPDDNTLKLELATPIYKFTAQNRIILESKDDIKKRMAEGASPDLADALALTFAFPVMPSNKRIISGLQRRSQGNGGEYDPYKRLNGKYELAS